MMSKITPEIVEKVAQLSRLSLSKEETALYAMQLNSILGYMEKLNELNTDNIEPTLSPNPNINVVRNDMVIKGLDLHESLSNAPESEDGYFQIPKLL